MSPYTGGLKTPTAKSELRLQRDVRSADRDIVWEFSLPTSFCIQTFSQSIGYCIIFSVQTNVK